MIRLTQCLRKRSHVLRQEQCEPNVSTNLSNKQGDQIATDPYEHEFPKNTSRKPRSSSISLSTLVISKRAETIYTIFALPIKEILSSGI